MKEECFERRGEYCVPEPVDFGELMAHFYIYADESGKLAKSDIVSFCGYVGHASECERTSFEWTNCRFGWQIPPVHMRFVMNPERDKTGEWLEVKNRWGAQWEDRRNEMLRGFASVLLSSNMVAVGASVDAQYFRAMPNSSWKQKLRDPVFLAFFTLLMDALDKVDRISKTLSVSIIVDNDPEHGKDYYELLEGLKITFPRVRERISAITFGNDDDYPALQMADMIAFESRALLVSKLKDPNVPPSDLYIAITKKLMHQPKLWTAGFLNKAAAT